MRMTTLALCLLAAPVVAEETCAPRDLIVARLAEEYGETLKHLGMATGGVVLEVYASDSGSWSIIATSPDGSACWVADGEMWQGDAAPLGPKGDPL